MKGYKQTLGQLIRDNKIIIESDKPVRKPRRIYITHSQRVKRIVTQVKRVKRVVGWPKTVTCYVCGTQKVSTEEAHRVLGGGMGHYTYWMCNVCPSKAEQKVLFNNDWERA